MALVSVLVRAYNDESIIGRTLEGIFSQKVPFDFEVVVCDDNSTDRTREIAAGYPVRFFARPEGAYKPGRTLNSLVADAKGEIVVFNNSDSVPLDENWLARLVAPLIDEPRRPRFTFANQLPRKDATALVRKDSFRAFGDGKVHSQWRFFFSLASSATRKELLAAVPFDEQIQYSEDVEWTWRNSRRATDPVEIIYVPDAHVEHSHNYTLKQLAKRFRGEGEADRIIFGDMPSLPREVLGAARETLRDFAFLARERGCWREFFAAPVRRLVQRVSHWQGAKNAVVPPRSGPKRILLGGIPLGCDNIGDEAIIAAVVKMLKKSLGEVELSVATRDSLTASRLGVHVCPLYGFDVPAKALESEIGWFDAYIWCGATGLSDYPHTALDLLEIAQRHGVDTYIWGVGMDDTLNPVFFKLHGKKKLILSSLNLDGVCERMLEKRLAARISRVLPRCKGIWLRDPQSVAKLAATGFPGAGVTADSAILLGSRAGNCPDASGEEDRQERLQPPVLGLCISAQRQVRDMFGVKSLVAKVRAAGYGVLGIPMNPKTDRALLESINVECITGVEPEDVMDAAAKCSLVLSSRLHLLILAANRGTPVMGIARGSKLANFLSNFGRTVEGDVYDCDWSALSDRVVSLLASPEKDWPRKCSSAYDALLWRLNGACAELVQKLSGQQDA